MLVAAVRAERRLEHLKPNRIEPSTAFSKEHHSEIQHGCIRVDFADDFVLRPFGCPDGTMLHVVEETVLTVVSIDTNPKLRVSWAANAHGCTDSNPPSAEGSGINALQNIAKIVVG